LYSLRDKGNSVFVVEHDPDVINACEWVVDMGPNAGSLGGNVVYNGELAGLPVEGSLTGQLLNTHIPLNDKPLNTNDFFEIKDASIHNLKNISVKIPRGVLTCIAGVSGSGKSTLIHECFVGQHPEAVIIDQSPIGKSSRANPATYTGIFDYIRKEFATATSSEASLFSFNSKGACPKCNGQGYLSYELNFIDAVRSQCDECEGKRYHAEVLALRYKGKSIADVLNMSIAEALNFFKNPKINHQLALLQEVGLGYLKLGQSLSTLSGGECQRLKIASELTKSSNIYIMDEPTTGLHRSDIETFFRIVRKLVVKKNTVIIIEHNTDILKRADWIIELGPAGGKAGGLIIAEGTPHEIKANAKSVTGKYL
jgi:excinuclease UvrABC ATPase subunit